MKIAVCCLSAARGGCPSCDRSDGPPDVFSLSGSLGLRWAPDTGVRYPRAWTFCIAAVGALAATMSVRLMRSYSAQTLPSQWRT
jgi:hypothetical protein